MHSHTHKRELMSVQKRAPKKNRTRCEKLDEKTRTPAPSIPSDLFDKLGKLCSTVTNHAHGSKTESFTIPNMKLNILIVKIGCVILCCDIATEMKFTKILKGYFIYCLLSLLIILINFDQIVISDGP